ncbi:hypothetical protein C9374_013568 [Naegleria lovaniensis]|uniref:Uncharacterized protein n=1 Tax=Naegleria lovaniensis TaxID=51637 RepID=A0AA88GZK3_NAELO|nr:uncharacterized protein C9374_013568 [Naegleria lovaniensis]KAG2392083.1 hypothetical protein C9374_013568 [Naegleria lovaniensis]
MHTFSHDMKKNLQMHIQPLAYGLSNDTSVDAYSEKTVSLVFYGIRILFMILLVLALFILLFRNWKEYVFNKRLMYSLMLSMTVIQVLAILAGIGHSTCSLLQLKEVIGQTFFMLYYEGIIIDLILSLYCQLVTTKMLFEIYFHKEQYWMRKNKRAWRMRHCVLVFAVSVAVCTAIFTILVVPAVLLTLMFYYFPNVNQEIARQAAIYRFYVDAVLGVLHILTMAAIGIINVILVVSLVKKLLSSGMVSFQRKMAALRMIMLSVGQFFLGISMGLVTFMLVLGLLNRYLFIVGGFLQTLNIFIFCVMIMFSFHSLKFLAENLERISSKRVPSELKENLEQQIKNLPENHTSNPQDMNENDSNKDGREHKGVGQPLDNTDHHQQMATSPLALISHEGVDVTPFTSLS